MCPKSCQNLLIATSSIFQRHNADDYAFIRPSLKYANTLHAAVAAANTGRMAHYGFLFIKQGNTMNSFYSRYTGDRRRTFSVRKNVTST